MSLATRDARTKAGRSAPRRAKLPPEEPSIPQRTGGTGAYWLYLLPGFALLLVVVIVPLIWNVYLTFTKWRGVGEPEFIGLENWAKLLTDEDFWTSFTNSIWMYSLGRRRLRLPVFTSASPGP